MKVRILPLAKNKTCENKIVKKIEVVLDYKIIRLPLQTRKKKIKGK